MPPGISRIRSIMGADRTAAPAASRHTGPHACRHAGLGPGRGLLPGLPGPLRVERARPQARAARAVGRAADEHRLQGRRPARHRRAPAVPRGPRGRRAVPQPGLLVGLEPPLPHVRLLHGGPAPRRRRRAARAARRGPRARDAGDPRRRLQPHGPRLLAVPPRPRDRRVVALSRLVPLRPGRARRRPADPRLPAVRHPVERDRVRRLVGDPGAAPAQRAPTRPCAST